jgi:hypothetical protein
MNLCRFQRLAALSIILLFVADIPVRPPENSGGCKKATTAWLQR